MLEVFGVVVGVIVAVALSYALLIFLAYKLFTKAAEKIIQNRMW